MTEVATLNCSPGDRGDHQPTLQEDQQNSETDGALKDEGGEVFCGRIPRDMTEEEVRTIFLCCGPITQVRLPKDPGTGRNRGFAFLNFEKQQDSRKAIAQMNGKLIRGRQSLRVTPSLPNSRLFVGNIPKAKAREELHEEFGARTVGLKQVIIYSCPDDDRKNRGFCFLEYESHNAAAVAKRRLSGRESKFCGCDIVVDWADAEQVVDDAIMQQVRILYVSNVAGAVSEEELRILFHPFGTLSRVKKMKDFAFVHFESRDAAAAAKEQTDGHKLQGMPIRVTWAKPPIDKLRRQQTLRAREKRVLQHQLTTPVHDVLSWRKTGEPTHHNSHGETGMLELHGEVVLVSGQTTSSEPVTQMETKTGDIAHKPHTPPATNSMPQ